MSSSITMGRRVALIVALISGLLYGCAANKPLIGRDQLSIDKISSDNVAIGDTYVRKSDGSIDITGKVNFRWATAGTPPGHVDIRITGPDGKELYKAAAHYYRNGSPTKRADTFNFSLNVPLIPPKGSTMQLEHHASQ